jgi:hypothetical protein
LLCAACADSNSPDKDTGKTAPWFTDITDESGLDFEHEAAATEQLHLPAVMGGGAAFFDFDNDGDLDIYLANGDHVLPGSSIPERGRNRLYRREADGRYSDVTSSSGLGDPGYGMGVATGDIDNDGWIDVFISNYGPDRLFHNQGDGLVGFGRILRFRPGRFSRPLHHPLRRLLSQQAVHRQVRRP